MYYDVKVKNKLYKRFGISIHCQALPSTASSDNMISELQIRGDIEDNSYFFLFSLITFVANSLEPYRRDSSNEGYNVCFR